MCLLGSACLLQVAVEAFTSTGTGSGSGSGGIEGELDFGLLEGKWRLEYTTARDVLPLVAPQRLPAPLQVSRWVWRVRGAGGAPLGKSLPVSVCAADARACLPCCCDLPLPAVSLLCPALPQPALPLPCPCPAPALPLPCPRPPRWAASSSASPAWRRGGCRT